MKRLLIDMDDVICENGFIRMINEFLGTNYKSEDANSYFVNDLIPKDKFEEWVKFFEEKNVYDYVNIVKDAPEVIEKLNEFYDIYIITAYIFRDKPEISGSQLKNKFDFSKEINADTTVYLKFTELKEETTVKEEKNPATNDMNLALILASLGLASAGAVLVSRKKLAKANR